MKCRAERIQAVFVKVLKELRLKRNLSHHSLANKAGVTRAAISHIEHGRRNPSLLVCLKLSQGLDIELSEMLKIAEAHCAQTQECGKCEYKNICSG